MDSHPRRRKTHPKVKSGCRTCKTRKVKCDESRPSCKRCIATGRECEGYGIWDDGVNRFDQRQCVARRFMSQPVPMLPTISILTTSAEEKSSLEWFQLRTARKLPASFVSDFWTVLLIQASVEEPAVLHAVLALSSVHKSGVLDLSGQLEKNGADNGEQVTLGYYLKAINHLQPHFLSKDKKSSRIALITCAIFVCLEFLRGHFETAQAHLRNGLKVLGGIQNLLSEGATGTSREVTDDWIVEVFSRLSLQVELFRPGYLGSHLFFEKAVHGRRVVVFNSLNDAWKELGWLFGRILHLEEHARHKDNSLQHQAGLLARQKAIQDLLTDWLHMYDDFVVDHPDNRVIDQGRACQIIRIYSTMASIMCSTTLQPTSTTIFDLHTEKFTLLISQLEKLWRSSVPVTVSEDMMQKRTRTIRNLDMPSSIVDMGWLPPLFYVATRCRIRRIRWRAMALMECLAHREGIWDSKIMARVARKVVEIEENNHYKVVDEAVFVVSGLLDLNNGGLGDEDLNVLPDENRLSDVEIILEGAPLHRILLFARMKREGSECRILLSEYNLPMEQWIDSDILASR